jgi:zinc transporter 1/2/3
LIINCQPWAAAISNSSVLFIFFIELFAFRWGTARINRISANQGNQMGDEAGNVLRSYDPHGHALGTEGAHAAHGPEPSSSEPKPPLPIASKKTPNTDLERKSFNDSSTSGTFDPDAHHTSLETHPLGQILSVVILEFGVLFHSFIVGLTLAVSTDFIPLLCVLIFHQLFEGLGLGTRLAYLTIFTNKLKRYALFPYFGALFFSLSTPIGIAIGLGVQRTYSPDSNTANIVSGVFDSFSSGILLYTGLVELLAHEFLFSKTMMERSTGSVLYAGLCVLLGAGLMALLGRWA